MATRGNPASGQIQVRELRAIVRGRKPGHTFNRPAQIARKTTRIFTSDREVFPLRYQKLCHPESVAERHAGLRTFIGLVANLIGGAALRERGGWYIHHIRGRALQHRAVEPARRCAWTGINEYAVTA